MPHNEHGFILTRHALDIGGLCQLHYYGISDTGPFKIVIPEHQPLFFIKKNKPIPTLPGAQRKPLNLKNFLGEDIDGLYFNSLRNYYNGRKKLRSQNISIFESDVRPADRYLMERHINGSLLLSGEKMQKNNLSLWNNPQISPSNFTPSLKWLSLDIETGRDGTIYSIALHGTRDGLSKDDHSEDLLHIVLMRDDNNTKLSNSKELIYTSSEKELLKEFLTLSKSYNPDLIIGWHVIGFDLMFIQDRCEKLSIPFLLGRSDAPVKIAEYRRGQYDVQMDGRIVIDGPPTLRSAFFTFEDYRLETVAQELLGHGKDIASDEHKVDEIERRFKEDKEALAKYNMEDTTLVTEIYTKTDIIKQLLTRSLIAGQTLDKVHMSVASFDHFMLPALHRHGLVAPDVADINIGEHAAGGHVFTSTPGLYHYVAVLDFKSLYPTVMRTFSIDPISRIKRNQSPVNTPPGISFSQTEHALPEFLLQLMDKRAAAKKAKDPNLSQAVKILMNSFYGVMGTPKSRFYHWELPTAITGSGQWILKESAAFIKELGYNVLYGDTDSVFVCLKEDQYSEAEKAGEGLAKQINDHFKKLIKNQFGVESQLEIEFEKCYTQFFLPAMRGTQKLNETKEGSRKRYVGMFASGEMELKGMEFVRSDWTDLAKEFQFELFHRFFKGEELSEWIKEKVKELKTGSLDEKLIYSRRIRRNASDYTKTTPPHIKAIRLIDPDDKKHIRSITYIITKTGPVPLQLNPFDSKLYSIDYNHYIEKQLKPIADGVLFVVDMSFDTIIGGEQPELF